MSGPVLTGPTTGPAGAVRFPAAAAGDVVAAAAAAGSSSGGDPPAADRNADEFDAVDDWDNLEPPPGDGWGHTYHNDRRYHLYMAGRYPFPNDRQEQTREHIKHLLMMALTVRVPAPRTVRKAGADSQRGRATIVCAPPGRHREDYRYRNGDRYAPVLSLPSVPGLTASVGIWALESKWPLASAASCC